MRHATLLIFNSLYAGDRMAENTIFYSPAWTTLVEKRTQLVGLYMKNLGHQVRPVQGRLTRKELLLYLFLIRIGRKSYEKGGTTEMANQCHGIVRFGVHKMVPTDIRGW